MKISANKRITRFINGNRKIPTIIAIATFTLSLGILASIHAGIFFSDSMDAKHATGIFMCMLCALFAAIYILSEFILPALHKHRKRRHEAQKQP